MADFAIPRGPINEYPSGAIVYDFRKERGEDVCRQVLREALHGVDLGSYDVDILNWLAGWEPATVAVVCSWLYRVREVSQWQHQSASPSCR